MCGGVVMSMKDLQRYMTLASLGLKGVDRYSGSTMVCGCVGGLLGGDGPAGSGGQAPRLGEGGWVVRWVLSIWHVGGFVRDWRVVGWLGGSAGGVGQVLRVGLSERVVGWVGLQGGAQQAPRVGDTRHMRPEHACVRMHPSARAHSPG